MDVTTRWEDLFSGKTLTPMENGTDVIVVYTSTHLQVSSDPTDMCVICDYSLSVGMKALRCTLGLCIMAANVVMVVAVVRARSLQMALKALLINLALADAMIGLFFTYLTLVVDIWTTFNLECRVRYGTLSYLEMVTLYSILFFSVTTVLTVFRPLHAAQLLTRKSLAVALTLLWLLPLAMTVVAYEMRESTVTECYFARFTSTEAFLIFAVVNIIAVIVIVICQVVILVIAKIQVNKIAPTMVGNDATVKLIRMNLRVAITTVVVVMPFLLCSTPLLGGYLHLALNPSDRTSKGVPQDHHHSDDIRHRQLRP
ncbi:cannabinoid receptor 1-like [Pomacea canaliculata]|nr:cannabinoid receptor 1-like [Pomacea canaliculata]